MTRLPPTAEMTLGPFFPPEFTANANDLTETAGRRARGEVVEIVGRVFEVGGRPLHNLVLEIWQADADGRYDNPEFLGWGRAATDAQGAYRFRTIRPGRVAERAPHINFLVLYSGLMRQLQTVMYFDEAADPVLQAVRHPQRLVAVREGEGRYRFDIRLRGEGETPFFGD
ncbi:MAG TPA: protocatechuate 3,4-dioxygenase subunit alpha [Burkholderiales bacterium]|nr:protocatechuate 3,4-dioxygenase subunit alpha [Burkholderiales bacterium]